MHLSVHIKVILGSLAVQKESRIWGCGPGVLLGEHSSSPLSPTTLECPLYPVILPADGNCHWSDFGVSCRHNPPPAPNHSNLFPFSPRHPLLSQSPFSLLTRCTGGHRRNRHSIDGGILFPGSWRKEPHSFR